MPRYRMVPVAPGAASPTDTARSKDHIVDLYEKLNALRKDADTELDRLRFRTTQMDDRMQELERRMPANPTAMDGASPYSFPTSTILDWRQLTQPLHLVLFVRGLPGVGKTTFAQTCFPERTLFEADLFAEGSRNFAERHARCQRALHDHLQSTDDGAIA